MEDTSKNKVSKKDIDSFKDVFGSMNDKIQSPSERIPMIKEVFELVLGREPSTREISFYKYGIQSKEEIIQKLLEGDDHKRILEKAKEYNTLDDRAKDAELTVVRLKQKIDDNGDEYVNLRELLVEKNKEIEDLRTKVDSPFDTKNPASFEKDERIEKKDETMYNELDSEVLPKKIEKKNKSFLEKILDYLYK